MDNTAHCNQSKRNREKIDRDEMRRKKFIQDEKYVLCRFTPSMRKRGSQLITGINKLRNCLPVFIFVLDISVSTINGRCRESVGSIHLNLKKTINWFR